MNGRRAIYPGSFDPITKGHLDIVQRGLKLFDHVTIAVAYNEDKEGGLFTPQERVEMIRTVTGSLGERVSVDAFHGLLVEYARAVGAGTIIRGLRAVADFEYEFQLATMNRHLTEEVETVFLTPTDKYTFISSTLVREIATLGGDISEFVSTTVKKALLDKVGRS